MHCKNLLVDNGGDWKAVEAVGECLPQLDVVPPLALVIEPVYSVNGSAFVVATKNKEVLWVLDLVCEEQADGLERLFSSIDIVSEEEVVGFRWKASVFK